MRMADLFGWLKRVGASHGGGIATAADVATLCVAAFLLAILVRTYSHPAAPQQPPRPAVRAEVGMSIKDRIAGVNWGKNGRTLVLAVSTQCHFCRESTPFYRKLRDKAGKSLKIVAVLPQPAAEAAQFFKNEGVKVDQVVQAGPESIGVKGTPTMLLVDGAGTVTKLWVGKVHPEQEQGVLAALGKG